MAYESESTRSSMNRTTIELQYCNPIVFEGCMDKEECDMYYTQVLTQQHGGTIPKRECHRRVVPRDTIPLSSSRTGTTTTSILRKSRYTKSGVDETIVATPRPRYVRRFSFSNHTSRDDDTHSFLSLQRSNSMRKIKSPRVAFHENVHVFTVPSIDDIPLMIQRNLWMSSDELMICMHEAMITKVEEETVRQQKPKSVIKCIDDMLVEGEDEDEMDDHYKSGILGRRHSRTSVMDEMYHQNNPSTAYNYSIPPVAA